MSGRLVHTTTAGRAVGEIVEGAATATITGDERLVCRLLGYANQPRRTDLICPLCRLQPDRCSCAPEDAWSTG